MAAVIAAPLAAALGGSVVATAISQLLVGVAFSALSTAVLGGQQAQSRPGIQTQFPGSGDVTPQSFPMGRYATEGHKAAPAYSFSRKSGGGGVSAPDSYFGRTGSGKYLTLIRSLSDTKLSALAGFYVDGVWFDYDLHTVEHDKLGRAVGGNLLDDTQSDYEGNVWVQFYDGTQTEASPYLVGAYSNHAARPWPTTSIFEGAAYVIITLRLDYDLFDRGEPEFRFVVDGLPLLDPRTGIVAPTNNAAVMAWNTYQSIQVDSETKYGVGLPRSALPDSIWFVEMNKCDLAVEVDGESEPQYRAGYEVKIAQPDGGGVEPLDVIDILLPTCSGSVAEVGGDVHIRVGAPNLPIAAISDLDLLLSEAESANAVRGIGEIHNSVAATYPDPANKWEATDAEVIADAAAIAVLGEERQGQVNLSAAPYVNQVKRLMEAWVKDSARKRVHGFFLSARWAATMVPLATFAWTSALHGYEGKLFEIQERLTDPMTGQIGLIVREVDPDDFSTFGINYTPTVAAPNPTQVIPFELSDFTASPLVEEDANGVARRGGIRGEWPEDDLLNEPVTLDFRVLGNDTISFSDVQTDGALGYLNSFHNAMLPNTAYQVRATGLIDGSSLPSPWVTVTTPNILLGALDVEGQRTSRALEIIAAVRSGKNRRDFAKLVAGFDGTLIDLQDENAQAIDAVSAAGLQARAILQAALEGQLDTTNADIAQLEAFLTAEIDGANAEIEQTQIAYAAADLVLAGQITSLTATVDGNTASISDTDTAVVALDVATANRFSVVETDVAGNVASITQESTARSNADGALSGRIDTVEAVSGANSASSTANQLAIATAVAAAAGFEQTTTASIGSLQTTVSIQGTALADVEGNQNASLILRADGASLVIASASNPNGPATTGISLGAEYVFVNGSLQSTNFNLANKVGWRLRQDGSFDFFGDLTRSAFAAGELQFDYTSYSKRYTSSGTYQFERSGIAVVMLVGGGGGGAAQTTNNSGTAGLTAGGGGGGGACIVVVPDIVQGGNFSIAVAAGGGGGVRNTQGYDNGNTGGTSTFSVTVNGKTYSGTAGGGQGGRTSNSSGGVSSGGNERWTGLVGRSQGGRGTTRFSPSFVNSSGSNDARPLASTEKMQAFWLDHSDFEVGEFGSGGRGDIGQEGDRSSGDPGEPGTVIVAYLNLADFN